jgi:N-acetylmuramoyl-L-alanine amidase
VHFNDYPQRKKSSPGDYSGFSIYVPEQQYSNSRSSREIAAQVSKQLGTYYPESNMPKEGSGVVEDQDLIAIGSFNTLDPASLLIEYGYIYEPQFLNPVIRSKVIEDLATQTYVGIHNFFGGSMPKLAGKYTTALQEPVLPCSKHLRL